MKTFESLLEQEISVMDDGSNKCLIGRVVNIRKKTYDVDVKGKGIIRCPLLNTPTLSETLRVGDFTGVFPTALENHYGNTTLDQGELTDLMADEYLWAFFKKVYEHRAWIPGRLLNATPKGWAVAVGGVVGIVPRGHLIRQRTALSEKEWKDAVRPLIGQRILYRFLNVDRKKNLLLLTRKEFHNKRMRKKQGKKFGKKS